MEQNYHRKMYKKFKKHESKDFYKYGTIQHDIMSKKKVSYFIFLMSIE